jgi:hypothetical protein
VHFEFLVWLRAAQTLAAAHQHRYASWEVFLSTLALYRSVLDQQGALLLMDNAKDAAQVAPLVPPRGCLMLVTSRQHFGLSGFHSIHLNSLTRDDARTLLLRSESRIGAAADELAELCGRLPLALELAANALRTQANLTQPNTRYVCVRRHRDWTYSTI